MNQTQEERYHKFVSKLSKQEEHDLVSAFDGDPQAARNAIWEASQ